MMSPEEIDIWEVSWLDGSFKRARLFRSPAKAQEFYGQLTEVAQKVSDVADIWLRIVKLDLSEPQPEFDEVNG